MKLTPCLVSLSIQYCLLISLNVWHFSDNVGHDRYSVISTFIEDCLAAVDARLATIKLVSQLHLVAWIIDVLSSSGFVGHNLTKHVVRR